MSNKHFHKQIFILSYITEQLRVSVNQELADEQLADEHNKFTDEISYGSSKIEGEKKLVKII